MLPIKRHLPRTNRRRWYLCPQPPTFIGLLWHEEYGRPFRWSAWRGRMPRTGDFILFLARRTRTRHIRTKIIDGDLAYDLYRRHKERAS